MIIHLAIVKEVRRQYQPKRNDFLRLLKQSLLEQYKQIAIDVLITYDAAMAKLNAKYRSNNQPTNVLALEYANARDKFAILNGEIILADAVVVAEATAQGKSIYAHYAHLFVHAMLHLQGLDHQNDQERLYMEQQEIDILQRVNLSNPYEVD